MPSFLLKFIPADHGLVIHAKHDIISIPEFDDIRHEGVQSPTRFRGVIKSGLQDPEIHHFTELKEREKRFYYHEDSIRKLNELLPGRNQRLERVSMIGDIIPLTNVECPSMINGSILTTLGINQGVTFYTAYPYDMDSINNYATFITRHLKEPIEALYKPFSVEFEVTF